MSKKDLVFELFDQGKGTNDPEVVALGLKSESRRKYYALWKKKQTPPVEEAPPIIEPSEVQLNSLKTAALFELKGERYRVGTKEPDCIVCHRLTFRSEGPLESDKMWVVTGQVSLATFTMVRPIK